MLRVNVPDYATFKSITSGLSLRVFQSDVGPGEGPPGTTTLLTAVELTGACAYFCYLASPPPSLALDFPTMAKVAGTTT